MNFKELVYQIIRSLRAYKSKFRIGIHREIFFELNLEEISTNQVQIEDLKIEKIGLDKVSELLKIWPIDEKRMYSRIATGKSICFVSYLKKEPAAYHWIQISGMHNIRPIGKKIDVPHSAFIFYHTRVSEKYRGKGINRFAMTHIIQEQKGKKYSRALIYTSAKNEAQIKSLEKLGFKKVKCIMSLILGNKYLSVSRIWE